MESICFDAGSMLQGLGMFDKVEDDYAQSLLFSARVPTDPVWLHYKTKWVSSDGRLGISQPQRFSEPCPAAATSNIPLQELKEETDL